MEIESFAVRCLIEHPTRRGTEGSYLYEERILLWRASGKDEAASMAEEEAKRYAKEAESIFLAVVDSFRLFDEVYAEGIEVWSSMRESRLKPELYIETFCVTPSDRAL